MSQVFLFQVSVIKNVSMEFLVKFCVIIPMSLQQIL